MKKIFCLIVALTAFIFGTFVYYIQPLFAPLSLSELRKHRFVYKPLKIKVAGKLEVVEENSRYFINLKDWENDCSGDNFCFQSLELSDKLEVENIALIRDLVEKNKTVKRETLINDLYWADGEYYVDVEVTGHLVEKDDKIFGGTFYDLQVEQLRQTSPIKFVPTKEMLRR